MLSILAAVVTVGLKSVAYVLTGSIGLLSDALESLVNFAAALLALTMITIAARPPDEEHAYGHGKAEYFASGAEGGLILAAAGSIVVSAVRRLLAPRPIEEAAVGVAVSLAASLVNLFVARILLRAGTRSGSIALEADARHLLTDVWTSCGVAAGVLAVSITGWHALDPVIALVVAGAIVQTGVQLMRRSVLGLMDTSLPPAEREAIRAVLAAHENDGIQFHALRTRQAGTRRFVSMHVLVPGDWSVARGHELLERIEADVRAAAPRVHVFTHLEPIEDPSSWKDESLSA
jgi:cation diffusion facilitator family transporter